MRKIVIAVAVLICLIVIALLVVPAFINVNSYRGRIEAELQQRLNRPVQLGQMHLKLLPPTFKVDNAVIGEDPRFGQQPFATVQELAVSVKLWPLLHKDVEVSSLTLERPHIELIRNAQGVWNFSSLGSAPSAAQQPPAPPQPQPQNPPQAQKAQVGAPPLQLDNLKITDGQVALTDFQKHQSRAVYDHIDLSLKNFAPDKQFDVTLTAHLPGKGTQTVALSGTAGPINQSNLMATPLDASLKMQEVSLRGVQKFLNSPSLEDMNGIITGEASVKNQNGVLSSQGSLKIDQANVNGIEIGYPISADYKASDDLNTDVIRVDQGNVKLGPTPLSVAGTLDTRATPAQVDLKLNAANVSLAEAARLASAFGVAFNPRTKVEGRALADVTAKGAISKPALNGSVSLRDVAVSGQDIPQPVRVPSVDLLLSPQQIRSNNFAANAGNTAVNVQFALSNYTSDSPGVDAALKTVNAQVADLISMARAYASGGLDGVSGSGALSLDVHAAGPLKNPDAMRFNGTGQIQNASVKTPTLRQPLNVRNANLQFTNNGAQVQNLNAALGQTNASGNITLRNFAAPNVQFTLNADKVNVAELQQIMGAAPATAPAPQRRAFFDLVPRAEAQTTKNPQAGRRPDPGTAESGLLAKTTGGGTVTIGTVQYDQLVLTNAKANVTLNRGVIGMSPITAQLYDGLENGAIVLDTRTTPMTVQVKSSLQRVRANDLVSSVSSIKNTIYGMLAANTQANFRATSAEDIAKTLNGTLALDLSNGRITKLDLLNQLAAIGKFAGLRKNAQAVTDFTRMSGHFTITNGVASTNDLKADIAGGSFAADGTVNLATQQLNMHLTAVMSKGFTDSVGGTGGIGGLMQTALANNKGEVVIPVLLTGTFDQPQVAPDLQKVAQMRMQKLLPSLGNPGQATAGILGNVLGGGGGTQPQGGIGGIIGAIAGQRQKQQQQPQQQQPAASQPQQKQQTSPLDQALGSLLGGKKKQQQQQQQQPPPK